MYIPYETIGNLPFFNKFKDKFYDLKVRQNLEYIAENYYLAKSKRTLAITVF